MGMTGIGAQLREIRDDPALRLYGSALALTHAVSMLFWRDTSVIGFLGRGSEAVCWPLVRGCEALRVLMVMFYVWASTLKLNADWISGSALPVQSWIVPASLTVAACVYLIILEMGVSWGLLARHRWVFWGALAQFYLFHAVSWQQVGFFFPMVMFFLVSIFPLARLVPGGGGSASVLSRLVRGKLRASAYGVIAMFSLFQLPPLLIPGDAALTGEGRSYALHMVDAGVRCRGWAVVRHGDGSVSEVTLSGEATARIACDPILIAERARNICSGTSGLVTDAVELDLLLTLRRRSAPELETVIDLPRFCARDIRYNPFARNWWILAER